MTSAKFWSKVEIGQEHASRFAAISFGTYGTHGIIPGESLPHMRG